MIGNVGFELIRLGPENYEEERAFLTRCRDALVRKEFFFPYTDEELRAVMERGEPFGIRKDGELVATFNIDLDEKYAERLGSIITESTRGAVTEERCYEASGLMTDGRFRGKGLGTALMDAVTERVKELKIDLCGVVHYENKASLNTFFRKEFAICGIYRQDSTYIFLYLLKKFDFLFENSSECVRINIRKIDAAEEALRRGMIGIGLDGDDLLFTKVSRKA